MRSINRVADTERFDRLVLSLRAQSLFDLPLGENGRLYYSAVGEEPRNDLSFLIEENSSALVAVYADDNDGLLGRFGMPAEILIDGSAPPQVMRRALKESFGILEAHSSTLKLKRINLLVNDSVLGRSDLICLFLASHYRPSFHFRAVVNLCHSAEIIRKDFRKGHRQQVRWGESAVDLVYVDANNRDLDLFTRFQKLHADVAGRVTRPDASWRVMYQLISSGSGDLVLSFFKGELVGGTLILDSADTAFYASGAYVRSHFDKPLSHYPLAIAIERAKARGLRFFDVGEVPTGENSTDKERSIGNFKFGFVSLVRTGVNWVKTREA